MSLGQPSQPGASWDDQRGSPTTPKAAQLPTQPPLPWTLPQTQSQDQHKLFPLDSASNLRVLEFVEKSSSATRKGDTLWHVPIQLRPPQRVFPGPSFWPEAEHKLGSLTSLSSNPRSPSTVLHDPSPLTFLGRSLLNPQNGNKSVHFRVIGRMKGPGGCERAWHNVAHEMSTPAFPPGSQPVLGAGEQEN